MIYPAHGATKQITTAPRPHHNPAGLASAILRGVASNTWGHHEHTGSQSPRMFRMRMMRPRHDAGKNAIEVTVGFHSTPVRHLLKLPGIPEQPNVT